MGLVDAKEAPPAGKRQGKEFTPARTGYLEKWFKCFPEQRKFLEIGYITHF
jgi:hypothetical protein